MKKKTLSIILLCAVIFIPLIILAVDLGSMDFSLNFQKYHSYSADGLTFDFYGSFGNVRKLKVSDDGGKLCSLEISADANVYGSGENAVELCDVNSDGKHDLLVLRSIDEDGDVHRSLFLYSSSDYRYMSDVDAVNFREDGGSLICEERTFKYLAQTVEEYTVPYERSWVSTEYKYSDGSVIPNRTYKLSYYSETQIYCFSEWQYDADLCEQVSVSEDWMDEQEYKKKYQNIDELFQIALP